MNLTVWEGLDQGEFGSLKTEAKRLNHTNGSGYRKGRIKTDVALKMERARAVYY